MTLDKLAELATTLLDTPTVLADWLADNMQGEDRVEEVCELLRGSLDGGWHITDINRDRENEGTYDSLSWERMTDDVHEWTTEVLHEHGNNAVFIGEYESEEVDGVTWPSGIQQFRARLNESPAPRLLNWLLTLTAEDV